MSDPEAHPLDTPSGKIEIASEIYAHLGFSAFPDWRGFHPTSEYPLYLITPHSRYRINSQYANDPWFLQREQQKLWMNPKDAAERGIDDSGMVVVASPQGRVRVSVRVTEDIMPGVVCLLAGMWPRIGEDGVDTAGAANILTSTVPTEPSRSSRTHSVAVQVRRVFPSVRGNDTQYLDRDGAPLVDLPLTFQRKAVRIRRGRATVTGDKRSVDSHWGTGKA